MIELISNPATLIAQGGELLKQPAVIQLFGQLGKWVSNLLLRNKDAKEKLLQAQNEQDNLSALKENLKFLEDWNLELQAELEQKANEIGQFTQKAGMDLSGANIEKAIVGNTMGNVSGGIFLGDNMDIGESKSMDKTKIIGAIKMLKTGMDIETTMQMSGFDKDFLSKIAEVIK